TGAGHTGLEQIPRSSPKQKPCGIQPLRSTKLGDTSIRRMLYLAGEQCLCMGWLISSPGFTKEHAGRGGMGGQR
ncbi:hypothetical protein P692DRAFT_20295576, partial [Suillus brevipes Sb2]